MLLLRCRLELRLYCLVSDLDQLRVVIDLDDSIASFSFAASSVFDINVHSFLDKVYVKTVDMHENSTLFIASSISVVRILLCYTCCILSLRVPNDLSNLNEHLSRVCRLLQRLTLRKSLPGQHPELLNIILHLSVCLNLFIKLFLIKILASAFAFILACEWIV